MTASNPAPPLSPGVRQVLRALEEFGLAQRALSATLSAQVDVPRASLSVLLHLFQNGPASINNLAQHLRVDTSVASRHVSSLVACGLVASEVQASDRRARTVSLTQSGEAKTVAIRTVFAQTLNDVLADWDDAALAAAAANLAELGAALQQYAATSQGTN